MINVLRSLIFISREILGFIPPYPPWSDRVCSKLAHQQLLLIRNESKQSGIQPKL